MQSPREALGRASRLVVKIGSTVITTPEGEVEEAVLLDLADQICRLVKEGKQVVIVTSGAIRAGRARLGLEGKHLALPDRQAAAAVGQIELIWRYRELFGRFGQRIAQVLITQAELSHRERYHHLRNTLNTLLNEHKVVPVLNENDPVSAEGVQIGENDRLAAVVASKLDADVLLSLSDVDGYYTADPTKDPSARLIPEVREITPEMERQAQDTAGLAGRGGMKAKIESAKLAMSAGVTLVIAHGKTPRIIERLLAGENLGTIFLPGPEKMRSRKRWIGYAARAAGKIFVDEGAKEALVSRGSSLLPVGITAVEGDFRSGDMVSVVDDQKREIARGLANYGAADLRKIAGCRTREIEKRLGHRDFDEAIHRDNLVLL
jgi:glutamate 5-kinase